jgi:hypothetical protein
LGLRALEEMGCGFPREAGASVGQRVREFVNPLLRLAGRALFHRGGEIVLLHVVPSTP